MEQNFLPRTVSLRRAASVAFAALVAAASSLPGARAETVDQLYEAAKAEGKVVYWSANDAEALRIMSADFAKAYPGVTVEHFEIQPGPATQRMIAEAQAGQVNLDLFDTPLSYLQSMFERDLVAPYDWKATGVKPDLVLYDDKCVDYYHLDVSVAYNTGMVQEGEINSWDDLLDPKWKGKVVLEARGIGLAILSGRWGQEKTAAYIDALKANGALILKGGTPTAEALAGGQAALAIGTYAGKMERYKEMGAPVNWAVVSPVPAMDYALCVPRNAAHPNAARLFTWWLTTKEGQESLWNGQRFGRLTGEILSPVGEAVREAGADVVLEDPDPVVSQERLGWAARLISGL